MFEVLFLLALPLIAYFVVAVVAGFFSWRYYGIVVGVGFLTVILMARSPSGNSPGDSFGALLIPVYFIGLLLTSIAAAAALKMIDESYKKEASSNTSDEA